MSAEKVWTTEHTPLAEDCAYAVRDYDGELRARFALSIDAEHYIRDRNRDSGIGETGDAHAEVQEAMRSRLDDLGKLIAVYEGHDDDTDGLGALGVDADPADDPETARGEAEERLCEYPLVVERTVSLEIVLGTGGPDDRLIFECNYDPGERHYDPDERHGPTYEIRRVLYRYSWTGSAEVELVGDNREVAEEFARRVVPELGAW